MTREPDDQLTPPAAERRPHQIEAHGDTRTDDWYWIRDRDDPAVLELLKAENAYTEQRTAHLGPLIEQIYDSMLARVQLTDVTYPTPKGPWAYYTRTIEGKEHGVLCRRPGDAPLPSADPDEPDPNETVILDQNAMAEGHDYFEIESSAFSADQRLVAYGVDYNGGLRLTVRMRVVETGQDMPEVIENAQDVVFAGNDTLFYTRPDSAMRTHQVWRHLLGTDPASDVLVWEEPDESYFLGAHSTKDGKFVLLTAQSRETSECRMIPADQPDSTPLVVEPRRQDVTYQVEHHHGELYILSNCEDENFAVYRAPADKPGRANWRVMIAHRDDIRLESLDVLDGYVVVEERGHATTAIRLLPVSPGAQPAAPGLGSPGQARVIEAPPAGTIMAAGNLDFDTSELRFATTSLIMPRTLHGLDLVTGETTELHRQAAPGYDPAKYATERRWAKSPDGSAVPVTLAWAVDRPAGPGPGLVYGYGSYEASMDPTFRHDRPIHPYLDRGFVYAVAHVRGGGEMARKWFLEGRRANKPNSFMDFVAVARYLVAEGLTTAGQLAATGRSAGGLLMGASVNLDPSAFGCVVAEVPFVDCLTTMLDTSLPLTIIEREDWGDPLNDPDAYKVIKAYSPYDNVKPVAYPQMLVTAGLNDPMVSYFEPTKWVQKLRGAHPDNRLRVFLRVELGAGHMGPSGRYHHWKERAFVMAFVADAVGAVSRLT
ncbi:MAG: S9 family peptidase [Acidimicrobiales bacterium]